MSTGPSFSTPMTSPAPVTTAAEADALTAHFIEVMDALVGVVRQETELVRVGHLGQATAFEQPKAELTRLYIVDALRLRASKSRLSSILPAAKLEALRLRHDAFRALLQVSMTVLATAHAVSEGIVRGVSEELARKSAPQTYGATGRTNVPKRSAAAPLTVSRNL
jgi:hypothetical protein